MTPDNSSSLAAVLFDADGVIQQPSPSWRAALEQLCGDPRRSEEFLADVFAAEKSSLTGAEDFRDSLAAVLVRWNSEASLEEALSVWTQIDADPEILSIVARLRTSGVTIALASNQQRYRAAFMTDKLGYFSRFDHLLYSCEIGRAKPDPEYFSLALQRLSIPPARALFIDDHELNVAAARECGLNAEVFHASEGAQRLAELLGEHRLHVA